MKSAPRPPKAIAFKSGEVGALVKGYLDGSRGGPFRFVHRARLLDLKRKSLEVLFGSWNHRNLWSSRYIFRAHGRPLTAGLVA